MQIFKIKKNECEYVIKKKRYLYKEFAHNDLLSLKSILTKVIKPKFQKNTTCSIPKNLLREFN